MRTEKPSLRAVPIRRAAFGIGQGAQHDPQGQSQLAAVQGQQPGMSGVMGQYPHPLRASRGLRMDFARAMASISAAGLRLGSPGFPGGRSRFCASWAAGRPRGSPPGRASGAPFLPQAGSCVARLGLRPALVGLSHVLDLGFRIGDALMENTRQDTLKVFAQEMQILKGQFGFVQLPFRKMPLIIVSIWLLIRAGVGSVRVRLLASTESASIRMAASLVCGRGPG